ncbi:Rab-GAP TBC domain-containing protein [Trichophyton interdigitale]|nr:Rab-GAP TBC domain-containing protein [Trichophyton interdigitale]KAG5217083.1 Rab-GAP TBC domain-containing protein [Trichophyton interdigitale]KAG8205583.1 Rab-GAP TBC domain-containing protein [Trichophyton interdigitale]
MATTASSERALSPPTLSSPTVSSYAESVNFEPSSFVATLEDPKLRDRLEVEAETAPEPLSRPSFSGSFRSFNANARPSSAWSRITSSAFASRERRATISAGKRSLNLVRGKQGADGDIPSIIVDEAPSRPASRRSLSERKWNSVRGTRGEVALRKRSGISSLSSSNIPPVPPIPPFQGIKMDIPSASLGDITSSTIDEANEWNPPTTTNPKLLSADEAHTISPTRKVSSSTMRNFSTRRIRSANSLRVVRSGSGSGGTIRTLSVDEEMLSRKVRLMYEKGEDFISEAELNQALDEDESMLMDKDEEKDASGNADSSPANGNAASTDPASEKSETASTNTISPARRTNTVERESNELAGGLEDWNDIENGYVDRYGFIIPHPEDGEPEAHVPQPLQRVSTSLMLASATPRRKRTMAKRPPSTAGAASIRSFAGRSSSQRTNHQPMRPTSSQSSYQPHLSRTTSSLRYAANKLPHNRSRKLLDEAGDMLTSPTQKTNSFSFSEDETAYSKAMRKKESEREDKWRKMAKLTSKAKDGSGMTFEFDVTSTKLIDRTWKGIPDSWRSTAWHAFLAASAKKRPDSPTEDELIRKFNELQVYPSPDDVQIDIDVPRTISSHIMFRRRYRGGQRLLFRVLHAMSLYFPETGYVQGMAALAATLLAYYDEENAFIMLVRLWQYRGLDRLYREGFAGLMEALNSFEKDWLGNGEVAEKLTELGIPPTAYGTRWYLTLFNYSIPFAAQLRVWDVFMLLGDSGEPIQPTVPASTNGHADATSAGTGPAHPVANPFGKSLDILHATSAALIDGMRDIILESDFENAMKVLTSWVPINDIELFMRVARTEWKVHCRKKGH